MDRPSLQVLLIEDNPGDADLVKDMLADAGDVAFRIDWADALLPGLDRLARGDIDLVLLDVSLPDSQGLDGLNAIRIHAPNVPIVLLTGWDNESLALRAVHGGAQDYLVKGKLDGATLARSLRRAVVRQQTQIDIPKIESAQQPAKIVGYLGAKGGVGTSTVACHISRDLNRQAGGRVLLMDLSAGANSIGVLMQVKGTYTILDASNDILHLDRDRWEKLVVHSATGVDIIQSAGPACQEERQPKAERIQFILRFVRTLYQWIVIDLGRLGPLPVRVARELGQLFLVSACDVLALNEAKWAIHALREAGFGGNSLHVILNQVPWRPGFSPAELQEILGAPVDAMLPESRPGLLGAASEGSVLIEGREFQKQIAHMAAGIAGLEEGDSAKGPLSFLAGVLRHATG
jgi:Flp pilus assembly CpaE family ATPase